MKDKKQKYTNRGFLDLEGYNDPQTVEVMALRLKNHPGFIEKIGCRIYLKFKDKKEKDYFFITTMATLLNQGYETGIVDEEDPYEKKESTTPFKEGIKALRTKSIRQRIPFKKTAYARPI